MAFRILDTRQWRTQIYKKPVGWLLGWTPGYSLWRTSRWRMQKRETQVDPSDLPLIWGDRPYSLTRLQWLRFAGQSTRDERAVGEEVPEFFSVPLKSASKNELVSVRTQTNYLRPKKSTQKDQREQRLKPSRPEQCQWREPRRPWLRKWGRIISRLGTAEVPTLQSRD